MSQSRVSLKNMSRAQPWTLYYTYVTLLYDNARKGECGISCRGNVLAILKIGLKVTCLHVIRKRRIKVAS